MITHELIPTNGIELHVASAGPDDGHPVVLCHGFPELWYSWRHQLGALARAGFRALAPDLRGYGSSGHPTNVADYGSDKLTGDLCGLLDHYGYDTAVFVGHDWGALVLWEMGRLHPQRVSALYNLSVAFWQPQAPPTEIFKMMFEGKFLHMLYFQTVGPPEAELAADPRHFVRTVFYAGSGEAMARGYQVVVASPKSATPFTDTLPVAPDQLPPWLTEHDIDIYAEAFKNGGFFGPISYYRNMDANWYRSKDIDPSAYTMPVGFLTGSLDAAGMMIPGTIEGMTKALPDFRGATTIEGAGHWVQQERPEETNAALLRFLSDVR